MIYGYSRVSTFEQSENSYALQQQTSRLKAAGAETVLEEVASRSRNDRELFKKLQDLMKQGLVSEVIVTRVDRISGSLPALREFTSLCIDHNVNLRILDQQIDLSTPHGRLMLNMLGSMAEWEIDMLKSRIDAGLKHQRSEGRVPGVVPFGYKRENDRYSPNYSEYRDTGKTAWQVARELIETFLEVQSVRGTARTMGLKYGPRLNNKGGAKFEDFPRENGLKYWLKSPVLDGHTSYYYRSGKKTGKPIHLIRDSHKALITPPERAEINRILSIPSQGRCDFEDPLPLAGLLHCAKCGRKMRAFHKKRGDVKIIRWYCYGQHAAPRLCPGVKGHRNEDATSSVIEALIEASDSLASGLSVEKPEAQDTPQVLELISHLAGLESMPPHPAIEEAKRSISSQIEQLRRQIVLDNEVQLDLVQQFVALKNPRFWLTRDRPVQRRLFRLFVDKVICYEDSYEVKLLL